jgi:hypothetical protein
VALVALGVSLTAALVAGGAVRASQDGAQPEGPIYSVSQLEAGLAKQPRQWVGRTIRVRAAIGGLDCPAGCTYQTRPTWDGLQRGEWLLELKDSDTNSVVLTSSLAPTTLVMAPQSRSRLLDALNHVPFLETLIPGQRVAWYGRTVYRLRIQARPCTVGHTLCYEGILTDAIPSDPFGW